MKSKNYILYCEQLISVIGKYPNLRIKELNGWKIIKGILDIPNDENEIVGSFSIEILFSSAFPYRFPILKEVGNDIPSVPDWHKYSNEQCCITVEANEILICKNGISVLEFVEKHVIPYFANQIHKVKFGLYKNGEYAHGALGVKQFYIDLFKTTDRKKWSEFLDIVFKNKNIKICRNEKCFCGSNIKFKKCHKIIFHKIDLIGFNQITNDLNKI